MADTDRFMEQLQNSGAYTPDPDDNEYVWYEEIELVPTGEVRWPDGAEEVTVQKNRKRAHIYDLPPQGTVPLIDGLLWLARQAGCPERIRRLEAIKAQMEDRT